MYVVLQTINYGTKWIIKEGDVVIPVSGSKLFFNEARVDRVISPVEVSQKN
jgi:hypothetical protein